VTPRVEWGILTQRGGERAHREGGFLGGKREEGGSTRGCRVRLKLTTLRTKERKNSAAIGFFNTGQPKKDKKDKGD